MTCDAQNGKQSKCGKGDDRVRHTDAELKAVATHMTHDITTANKYYVDLSSDKNSIEAYK